MPGPEKPYFQDQKAADAHFRKTGQFSDEAMRTSGIGENPNAQNPKKSNDPSIGKQKRA